MIRYVTLNRGSYWLTMEIPTGKKNAQKVASYVLFGDPAQDCPLGTNRSLCSEELFQKDKAGARILGIFAENKTKPKTCGFTSKDYF